MERTWRPIAIERFPSLRSYLNQPGDGLWEIHAELTSLLAAASASSDADVLETVIAFAGWCRSQRGIRHFQLRRVLGDGLFESLFDVAGDWSLIVSFLSHEVVERYQSWWEFSLGDESWRELSPLLDAQVDSLTNQPH